jgi:putative ABC transport system permease protein
MNALLEDLRQAGRSLLARPAFCAVAVLTLALGIAAATVVASAVHGVLLRPLPFPSADRLLQVFETPRDRATGEVEPRGYFAWQNYADVRDEVGSFAAVAAWQYYDKTLTGTDSAQRLAGRMVTPEFFTVFGVAPQLGRAFTAAEAREGSQQVAILSDGVWRGAFGADPAILGRSVRLDGASYTVVGVMPPGFDFPYGAQLWMPLVPFLGEHGEGARRFHRYRVVGRLAPGTTREEAGAELATLAQRLAAELPDTNGDDGLRAEPLADVVVGEARPALAALAGAVVCLLLIVCANLASLLLGRAAGRGREIAVRAALGARRGRIVRQLLAESLLLAAAGGLLGVLLASWGVDGFKALVGDALPRLDQVRLDGPAVAFGLAAAALTGLLFGLAPALQLSRPGAPGLLAGAGRSATGDRDAGRLRRLLVVAEITLAVVLAVGATLLIRSFERLAGADTGVDTADLLTLDVALPEAGYADPARATAFYDDLLERLQALPRVRSAAAALIAPLAGNAWGNYLYIEGRPLPEAERPTVGYAVVTPGYFRTAGIRLAEGRELAAGDRGDRLGVVVNRTLAERYWPGESAVGRRIRFREDGPWATIVGVAADVPPRIGETAPATAYVPPAMEPLLAMTLLVRTDGSPTAVVPEIRALLRDLDPDVPVTAVATLDELVADSIAQPRTTTAILSLFALAALALAALGVYGVLAYLVSRRIRELGIRSAVGARPRDLLWLVLREGTGLALAGVALGIAGALAAGRLLSGLLYGVTPTDPLAFGTVAVLALATALLAAWLPARRAAQADPVAALRGE